MTAATYLAEPEVVLERSIRTARSIGTSEVRWALQCLMDLLAEKEAEPVRDEKHIAVVKAQIEGYSQALLRRGADLAGAVDEMEGEVEEPRKGGNGNTATTRVRASLLATEKQVNWIKRLLAERNLAPEQYGITMERLDPESPKRISKDKASDMVDKLLAIKVRKMMSDGQRDLLATLTVEGHENVTMERALAVWTGMQGKVEFETASKMIDRAKAANRKRPAKAAPGKPEDGYYEMNGDIIKVQWNRAGTHMYAKRLRKDDVHAGFQVESGLVNRMQGATPLTPETAAVYGPLYGRCLNPKCSRLLTDEESIARGFGPECWGKMGW